MEIYFLGTGAGLPSRQRNVTSILFHALQVSGHLWMFDCGEGTQQQLLSSPYSVAKINQLFVTHMHGDHIYGIPGLLSSRSFSGVRTAFQILGPPGIKEYVEASLSASQTYLSYPLTILEIQEGLVYEDEKFRVHCRKLAHGIDSYGYRIEETTIPGRLKVEELQRLGIPAGPIYQQLKHGNNVEWEHSQTLYSSEFTEASKPGRVVVICGDTMATEATVELALGADLLIHEATYDESMAEKAQSHHHSTTAQAAQLARESGVKQLLLTHISARYDEQTIKQLEREAAAIFPDVQVAHDHLRYTLPRSRN